jgi:ABC-2 type transport system ATP-binding protein
MSEYAISTSGLTKRYRGGVLAVDQIDMRVARGEIYAFLGLNGAGKSTTIRLLLGMIRPTAGHAEVFGVRAEPAATHLWRRVGHLVETATAYPELTTRENLDVARKLAGVKDRAVVSRLIDQLSLGPYADRRAGTRCHSAISSGSRSPARLSTSPTCWCSTSRPTASTRPASSRFASCSDR